MDIYEATQTLLQSAVPADVNVSAYVLTYDELLEKGRLTAELISFLRIRAWASPSIPASG